MMKIVTCMEREISMAFLNSLLSSNSKTKITFYGGIHEIGGNKFLVEDKGTRIFLDFGMQISQYFAEFVNPRICNGMGDLFEFELLPRLKGLYRKDYSKHMGFDGSEDTEFHAILLSHAHIDHGAYIHYLRPDIPVYCSEATKLIMQALQDTGSTEEYITCGENFRVYKNKKGELSRCKGEDYQIPRNIEIFQDSKPFSMSEDYDRKRLIVHKNKQVWGWNPNAVVRAWLSIFLKITLIELLY